MAKVWRAAETEIYIADASAMTPDASSTLFEKYPTAGKHQFSSKLKNVTIAEPEGAIEKVDLCGVSSSFQNAELDFKPYGIARISGSLLHESDWAASDALEEWVEVGTDYNSGGSHAFQPGKGTYGDGRVACAILVRLYDTTDEVNILMDNAYITKLGDRRLSGADGHWEQDFEAVCLPSGYFVEYKDAV